MEDIPEQIVRDIGQMERFHQYIPPIQGEQILEV